MQLVLDVACEQPYLKSPILQLAYHLHGSSARVRQVCDICVCVCVCVCVMCVRVRV